MKEQGRYPLSDATILRRLASNIMPPLMDCLSGEITGSIWNRPIGVAHMSGRVSNFYISAQRSGQDDDASLNISGELYINGTSCLTTKPSIGYVSGEANQHKTTRITGDSAIVQAVVNGAANEVVAGDVLSYDLQVNSQTSPDAKLKNPCVVVVIEPRDN